MKYRLLRKWIWVAGLLAYCMPALAQEDVDVRVGGTISTKPFLVEMVPAVKESKGLKLGVTECLTSMDVLDAVATGKLDIGIMTKPLTGEDRTHYPGLQLVTVPIGMEVVAVGVSNELWEAGVTSITKETMRGIYEQKITNWKDAGGPDEKVKFFNFQQGLGVWEIFAEWVYGDNRKAPLPKFEKMATSEDARDSLEFTPGAIAPLAAPFADGSRCQALAIDVGKRVAKPTIEGVASGNYPLERPINVVVAGRPALSIRVVTEFMTGPAGQALVKKAGNLGLEAVPKARANPYY